MALVWVMAERDFLVGDAFAIHAGAGRDHERHWGGFAPHEDAAGRGCCAFAFDEREIEGTAAESVEEIHRPIAGYFQRNRGVSLREPRQDLRQVSCREILWRAETYCTVHLRLANEGDNLIVEIKRASRVFEELLTGWRQAEYPRCANEKFLAQGAL